MADEPVIEHTCEVCGKVENLTSEQAYQNGWDYPPSIGEWGVLSPRTCPNCTIDGTAWWAVVRDLELTQRHWETIERIRQEQLPSG